MRKNNHKNCSCHSAVSYWLTFHYTECSRVEQSKCCSVSETGGGASATLPRAPLALPPALGSGTDSTLPWADSAEAARVASPIVCMFIRTLAIPDFNFTAAHVPRLQLFLWVTVHSPFSRLLKHKIWNFSLMFISSLPLAPCF